jgi:hypothetical protein
MAALPLILSAETVQIRFEPAGNSLADSASKKKNGRVSGGQKAGLRFAYSLAAL